MTHQAMDRARLPRRFARAVAPQGVPMLGVLLLGVFLCGCAGYRLGPTNGLASGDKTIQVNPFRNNVLEEPRLSDAVTVSLRKRLQQEGTFKLATHNRGDIIVDGTIVDFDRAHLTFQPQDILTPRDYRLSMTAHVTARDRITGKTVVDRSVTGHTTIRVGPDSTSVERQAIPLMAQDLARRVTDLLVDGEW